MCPFRPMRGEKMFRAFGILRCDAGSFPELDSPPAREDLDRNTLSRLSAEVEVIRASS